MTGILETIWEYITNFYSWILSFFDFELFEKNIRYELDKIIQSLVLFLMIFLIFKTLFSKSESSKGKFLLVTVFVLIYLFVNIWIFE